MKHLGDITKIHGASVEPVEVIIGGSPCQDLSVAGKRAGLDGDKFRCYNCGEVVEITDPEMLKWFEDRSEIKYEYQDCPRIPIDDEGKEFIGCGGKGTMKVMYVRNNATLEWQTAQGKCEKCGMSFIV